jgi:peptidoglycan-associated lipoprotein
MKIPARSIRTAAAMAAVATIALGGCTQYVKKADYDLAIQQLQQKDQQLQGEIDSLKQDVQSQFSALDAKVTAMQGRINVDTVAHFAYNDATLRDEDKPALDDFAKTIKQYHPDVLITVEGFADPAGSKAYNRKLGMKRAEAVRDELVADGLSTDQVKTVSYGESRDRQVTPGASRDEGGKNRRASLTIDFAGSGDALG